MHTVIIRLPIIKNFEKYVKREVLENIEKKIEASSFSFSSWRYDIFIKRITPWMRTLSSCFQLSIVFVL